MNKNLIVTVCQAVEVACIVGIAAIGFKRNEDAYKAQLKCIEAETKVFVKELQLIVKDAEIKSLKNEIAHIKGEELKGEEP